MRRGCCLESVFAADGLMFDQRVAPARPVIDPRVE
jgi:hypothetical protein